MCELGTDMLDLGDLTVDSIDAFRSHEIYLLSIKGLSSRRDKQPTQPRHLDVASAAPASPMCQNVLASDPHQISRVAG